MSSNTDRDWSNAARINPSQSCFVNASTHLVYAEVVPIAILAIITIMLIEAGSHVDEDNMIPLEG